LPWADIELPFQGGVFLGVSDSQGVAPG
jgi:hypothetical protein